MNMPIEQPGSVNIGTEVRQMMVEHLKGKTLKEKDLEGIGLKFDHFFGFEKPEGQESLPIYQDRAGHQYMLRKNGEEYKLYE